MPALIIILSLLAFIWLILMIPASLIIKYDTDFSLKIKVLFITKYLIPKKRKLPGKNGYSARKYRKKLKALEKKRQKAASGSGKKKKKNKKTEGEKPESEKPKRDLRQTVELVTDLIRAMIVSFGKHLRIKAERLHIVVASPDAATTAVMYGAVSQSLSYLMELLNRVTNFRYRKEEFSLDVDFLSDKPTADVYFEFRLRGWHVLVMLFNTGIAFIKNKIKNAKKKKSENGEETESDGKNETNETTNTENNSIINDLEELENG